MVVTACRGLVSCSRCPRVPALVPDVTAVANGVLTAQTLERVVRAPRASAGSSSNRPEQRRHRASDVITACRGRSSGVRKPRPLPCRRGAPAGRGSCRLPLRCHCHKMDPTFWCPVAISPTWSFQLTCHCPYLSAKDLAPQRSTQGRPCSPDPSHSGSPWKPLVVGAAAACVTRSPRSSLQPRGTPLPRRFQK